MAMAAGASVRAGVDGGGTPACLTFLTDYGYEAGLVGTLHAVAFEMAPHARVIDLDHTVPAGNVRAGAIRLEHLSPYLPSGVHVAIVDPGVGSARRPVAISAGNGSHLFVGPDNGLLVFAAEASGGISEAVVLDDERYFLSKRSRTFDGRDVFVPVSAHLLNGSRLPEVGSAIDPATLVRLERPSVRRSADGAVEVEVIQIDGFGNVQLGAGASVVEQLGLRPRSAVDVEVGTGSLELAPRHVEAIYGETFSDVARGEALLLLDSDGQLAFSVNGGRGDRLLGAGLEDRLLIRPAGSGRS